jgi:IS5 family transposase
LLQYTKQTKAYLALAISLMKHVQDAILFPVLQSEAENIIFLTEKVISQTERRVLQGEKVPHEEKVFSIFETHTDIIIKGARDIQYGHKLNLTTGKSGLVLDVFIEQGNPADTARLCPMIERQQEIYGRVPRQVAVDGGYASTENLEKVKGMGVKDAAFHKKRGLKIEDMVKSNWVYKKLRNFRAGVEGNISCLKRRYGLSRCTWRGLEKFKAYIWSSTVAYNLMLLARLETAD